jgi:hypothetical protein
VPAFAPEGNRLRGYLIYGKRNHYIAEVGFAGVTRAYDKVICHKFLDLSGYIGACQNIIVRGLRFVVWDFFDMVRVRYAVERNNDFRVIAGLGKCINKFDSLFHAGQQ